jgi:hypothetical protein
MNPFANSTQIGVYTFATTAKNTRKPHAYIGNIVEFTGHVNQPFLVLNAWHSYEEGLTNRPIIMAEVVRCTKQGKRLKTYKPTNKIIEFIY